MDTTTLAILVIVAIIYLLIIIGAILFIVNKRRGVFKQWVDPKPEHQILSKKESES